jgi:hypothetical protein
LSLSVVDTKSRKQKGESRNNHKKVLSSKCHLDRLVVHHIHMRKMLYKYVSHVSLLMFVLYSVKGKNET